MSRMDPASSSVKGAPWNRFRLHKSGILGLLLVSGVLALAAVGPLVLSTRPEQPDLSAALLAPSWAHPLGTDSLGRDMLARTLAGARVSLLVAVTSSLIAVWLGAIVGFLTGWYGKGRNNMLTRVIGALDKFPDLILVVTVSLFAGTSPLGLTLALSSVAWIAVARCVRREVGKLRQREHVQSSRALGFRALRFIPRDVLPHLTPILLALLVFRISSILLLESTMSFLGLGLQAPATSWGVLAADGWSTLTFHAYLVVFPMVAIFVTILGFNLIGDGLQGASGNSVSGRRH